MIPIPTAAPDETDMNLNDPLDSGGPVQTGRAAPTRLSMGWAAWLRDLLIAVTVALVIVLFLYQPVRVEGYSMMPRLQNDERLFVNKFAFHFEPVRRGDVVVFWYPRDTRLSFIKRIIGVPGDRVAIREGIVYVNGIRLREPYVLPRYRDHGSYPSIIVPAGGYYVLGDHRNSSNDSRMWGFVPAQNIYGKAVFAYWPMDDFGLVH